MKHTGMSFFFFLQKVRSAELKSFNFKNKIKSHSFCFSTGRCPEISGSYLKMCISSASLDIYISPFTYSLYLKCHYVM